MFKIIGFSAILALFVYCNAGRFYENELQEIFVESVKTPVMDIFDIGFIKNYTFGNRVSGNLNYLFRIKS